MKLCFICKLQYTINYNSAMMVDSYDSLCTVTCKRVWCVILLMHAKNHSNKVCIMMAVLILRIM